MEELDLLSAIGYSSEGIAELLGGGADFVAELISNRCGEKRSLGDVSRVEWAQQFIRLRVDYLYSLRRQQQIFVAGHRLREARQLNPDIDRAISSLFKVLEQFGLVGLIERSEISPEGRDARQIQSMIADISRGIRPPPLTEEQERHLLEEQAYGSRYPAVA